MFVLSVLRASCCSFSTLARVTKAITIEAFEWVRNEKIHLHLQVSDLDLVRKTRLIKRQEEGVPAPPRLFFQRHSTNFYDTLILELISDFQLAHS